MGWVFFFLIQTHAHTHAHNWGPFYHPIQESNIQGLLSVFLLMPFFSRIIHTIGAEEREGVGMAGEGERDAGKGNIFLCLFMFLCVLLYGNNFMSMSSREGKM